MLNSIFVYGTLKRGQLRGSMWPCKPVQVQPAIIKAHLYDTGSYPAILVGEDDVLGELWTLQKEDIPKTLSVLDEIEGFHASRRDNLYVRVETDVCLEDGALVRAFVYRYAIDRTLNKMRRILPHIELAGRLCASWPDAIARVSNCLADE